MHTNFIDNKSNTVKAVHVGYTNRMKHPAIKLLLRVMGVRSY